MKKALLIAFLSLALATVLLGATSLSTRVFCDWVPTPRCLILFDARNGYVLLGALLWPRPSVRGGSLDMSLQEMRASLQTDVRATDPTFARESQSFVSWSSWNYHGFEFVRGPLPFASRIGRVAVVFPLWFSFTLFMTYPAIVFLRGPLRRWHRQRIGVCVKCAYNLFGNTSGICPECGAKIADQFGGRNSTSGRDV